MEGTVMGSLGMDLLTVLQGVAKSNGALSPAQDLMRRTLTIMSSSDEAPEKFVRLVRAFKDHDADVVAAVIDWVADTMPFEMDKD